MIRSVLQFSIFALFTIFSLHSLASENPDLDKEKALSAEYVSQMAQEKDATLIDQSIVLRPIFKSESSVFPTLESTVHVSYFLTDRENHTIEESITSDEIVSFPLNKLIKCWQLAIPKMSVGSAYKVTCPSETAYGDKGAGDQIKPGAALTFRITLYGI